MSSLNTRHTTTTYSPNPSYCKCTNHHRFVKLITSELVSNLVITTPLLPSSFSEVRLGPGSRLVQTRGKVKVTRLGHILVKIWPGFIWLQVKVEVRCGRATVTTIDTWIYSFFSLWYFACWLEETSTVALLLTQTKVPTTTVLWSYILLAPTSQDNLLCHQHSMETTFTILQWFKLTWWATREPYVSLYTAHSKDMPTFLLDHVWQNSCNGSIDTTQVYSMCWASTVQPVYHIPVVSGILITMSALSFNPKSIRNFNTLGARGKNGDTHGSSSCCLQVTLCWHGHGALGVCSGPCICIRISLESCFDSPITWCHIGALTGKCLCLYLSWVEYFVNYHDKLL